MHVVQQRAPVIGGWHRRHHNRAIFEVVEVLASIGHLHIRQQRAVNISHWSAEREHCLQVIALRVDRKVYCTPVSGCRNHAGAVSVVERSEQYGLSTGSNRVQCTVHEHRATCAKQQRYAWLNA